MVVGHLEIATSQRRAMLHVFFIWLLKPKQLSTNRDVGEYSRHRVLNTVTLPLLSCQHPIFLQNSEK